MARVRFTTTKPIHDSLVIPGVPQIHYGYVCTINADGQLEADIPEDLVAVELASGRAVLVE